VVGVIVGMSAAVLTVRASLVPLSIALLAALVIVALAPSVLRRLRGVAPVARADGSILLLTIALIATAALFVDEVFQGSYLSEEQHYLLSEPLAMAGQLLFAACAIAYNLAAPRRHPGFGWIDGRTVLLDPARRRLCAGRVWRAAGGRNRA
jgi:hypothetical protein